MRINLYDKQLNRLRFIDKNYISLLWKEYFNKSGFFTIEIANTVDNLQKFKTDNYIGADNTDALMVIKSVEVKKHSIIVSGYTADRELEDVAFIGKIPANSDINIAVNSAYEQTNKHSLIDIPIGETTAVFSQEISNKSIAEIIRIMCAAADIGYKARKNNKRIDIVFYKAAENKNLKFASKFGNLLDVNFLKSTNKYKNIAIVLGQGEGDDRVKVIVDIRNDETERAREMIVDARDLVLAENETLDEYVVRLQARGIEKLLSAQNIEDVDFLPFIPIDKKISVGEIGTVILDDNTKFNARINSVQYKVQNNETKRSIEIGNVTSYSNIDVSSSGTGGGSTGGGFTPIVLTLDEYQALVDSGKIDEKQIYIVVEG